MKNGLSNEGHTYLIEVLETALTKLSPLRANEHNDQTPETGNQEDGQSAPGNTESLHDFSHQFEALNIKQSEDLDDISLPEKSNQEAPDSNPKNEEFELAAADDADIIFQIYCFFEDLHEIQDFLQETWRRYKSGDIDLINATLTTTAAIELVKQAEERILAVRPNRVTYDDPYRNLTSRIYFANALEQGSSLDNYLKSIDSSNITSFEEFVYLPTARTLMNFKSIHKKVTSLPGHKRIECLYLSQLSYIVRSELRELPAIGKWVQEDEVLSKLLLDVDLYQAVLVHVPSHDGDNLTADLKVDRPIEDAISKGIRLIRENHKVSVWTVFACRALLDIMDILGVESLASYEKMMDTAKVALAELDVETNPDGRLVPREGEETWLRQDYKPVLRLFQTARVRVIHNATPILKREALNKESAPGTLDPQTLDPETHQPLEKRLQAQHGDDLRLDNSHMLPQHQGSAQKSDLRPIRHSKDELSMFKLNPLYCGMMCFQMMLDLEASGITLSNRYESIFLVANVYNAGIQTGLLDGPWAELDTVIDLHKQSLFAGEVPTTPREMYSRMRIKLHINAQISSRHPKNRASIMRHLQAREKSPLEPNATLDCFRKHYWGDDPMKKCLHGVETHIQQTWGLHDKKRRDTEWTPIQLLRAFEMQMREEMKPFWTIKYKTLMRECIALLEEIRLAMAMNNGFEDARPDNPLDGRRDPNELMHHFLVYAILQDLDGLQELRDTAPAQFEKFVSSKASPIVNTTMKVMKEFIRTRQEMGE